MKKLREIIKNIEIKEKLNFKPDIMIKGITENSKEVKKDYLFFARKGLTFNGEEYIEEAISKGANVIIRETPSDNRYPDVVQIQVNDIKNAISQVGFNFYDTPQKNLILIGITGTNGKTSVSYFIKTILDLFGKKTGYIGTLFYETDRIIPSKETTPGILKILSLLKEMNEKHFYACVTEVSSHALDQDRLLGLKFDICAFTNLSQDHLDYHKTIENYYQSKKKLFTKYTKSSGSIVISLETKHGYRLAKELENKNLILVNGGDIKTEILDRKNGLFLKISIKDKTYKVKTQILGDYQAKNIATTLGVLLALGYKEDEIIEKLKYLKNPIGRLEVVGRKQGAPIIVDYAHTPEALKEVLKSLRPLVKNKLIITFGCGGNRDRGKRPLMGRIASLFADEIVLTSDNPRYEDPLKIIEEIKQGLNGSKPYYVIPDRREAIRFSIEKLKKGDVLLIAGKGHETYQEIQGIRYPFSDQEEILKILTELGEK